MHDDAFADDEYCPDGHGNPNGDDMPTPQYLCTVCITTRLKANMSAPPLPSQIDQWMDYDVLNLN